MRLPSPNDNMVTETIGVGGWGQDVGGFGKWRAMEIGKR